MPKGRRGNGEGSAPIKRTDGRWACFYSNERTGKRVWVYGKTSKEAASKRNEALENQRQGKPVVTTKQTVGQYLDEWLRDTASVRVRATTLNNYRRCLVRVIPHLGRYQLRDLGAQHITHCYTELASTLSPNTVRSTHTVLSLALNDAEQWDLIPKNPARRATLPPAQARQINPLTWEHMQRLLVVLSSYRLFTLCALLVNTGLRRGEALGLHWQDVDLEAGSLTVRCSLQKVKGVDGTTYEFLPPKTKTSYRVVPLNADMIRLLKLHRVKQQEEIERAGTPDNDLVFRTSTGNLIDPDNASTRVKSALKQSGMEHYRLHDLRHGFATLLFQKQINVKDVSALLGHSSVSITYDLYTHVLPAAQNQAVATLEGLVDSERLSKRLSNLPDRAQHSDPTSDFPRDSKAV